MARFRRFFAEAPIFFIALVVGIALTFRVAIGWAKSSAAEDASRDPTLPTTAQPAVPAVSAVSAVTSASEPRPAATATVPATPRKKPRPHR